MRTLLTSGTVELRINVITMLRLRLALGFEPKNKLNSIIMLEFQTTYCNILFVAYLSGLQKGSIKKLVKTDAKA